MEVSLLLQGLPLGRREGQGFVLESFFLGSAEGFLDFLLAEGVEDLGSGEDALAEEPLLDGFGVGLERPLPFGAGEEGRDWGGRRGERCLHS